MIEFSFTKQKHTGKTNVWYDGILIGELTFIMRESDNIDWPKYRADKTLKMTFGERWLTTWKAHTTSNMINVGTFITKEAAAVAILDEHRKKFEREYNDNNNR